MSAFPAIVLGVVHRNLFATGIRAEVEKYREGDHEMVRVQIFEHTPESIIVQRNCSGDVGQVSSTRGTGEAGAAIEVETAEGAAAGGSAEAVVDAGSEDGVVSISSEGSEAESSSDEEMLARVVVQRDGPYQVNLFQGDRKRMLTKFIVQQLEK